MIPKYFSFMCYYDGKPCLATLYYAQYAGADRWNIWFYHKDEKVVCGLIKETQVKENIDNEFFVIMQSFDPIVEDVELYDMTEVI